MNNYSLERQEKKFIIGIELRTNNDESHLTIPKHWGKFFSEGILEKIPSKKNNTVFAVYTDYEKDHTKPYSCIIGCEVTSLKNIPSGMVGKIIPGAKYAVYTTRGAHPDGLIKTWQEIWKSGMHRAFTADFEEYLPSFDPEKNPEVKVYIAL